MTAIYHFARTADDLADEGPLSAEDRLDQLAAYRADLLAVYDDKTPRLQWEKIFKMLGQAVKSHGLPKPLLLDLLDAFEQDVRYTASQHRYRDLNELLDYCQRSAAPIGRLLLHLYGVTDALSLRQSDAVCSALQLINFWQDLSVDLPRQRRYLPADHLARFGVDEAQLLAKADAAPAEQLVQALVEHACALMREGAPLALRLPGRVGWELRLVVQGGLRIADRLRAIGYRSWLMRPALGKVDVPLLLWRAWRMHG